MLRIRTHKNEVTPVVDGRFVEITDLQGRVAAIFFATETGEIKQIEAGDPEAERYAKLFGVELCPVKRVQITR